MKRFILFTLILLLITVTTNAQTKKKKSFFGQLISDVTAEFKPIPGQITKRNVDEYYEAFLDLNTTDTSKLKLINDPSLHIAFPSKLSKYDERVNGFFLTSGIDNYPELKSESYQYRFILSNFNEFRFVEMSDEQIKNNFNTEVFGNNVSIRKEKEGGQNLMLWTYFRPDSAYENKHGVRIISGTILQEKVEWQYRESSRQEIAFVTEPQKDIPISTTTLENTKLYKYLADFPFYTDEDWPKICFTFKNIPEQYNEVNFIITDKYSGAFQEFMGYPFISMKATIWESETKKIEIPEFTYFPCDFSAFNLPLDQISTWGLGTSRNFILTNTGYKRTSGPTPPKFPLPQSPERDKAYFGYKTLGSYVVLDILNKISYEINKEGDRRVWFNIEQTL